MSGSRRSWRFLQALSALALLGVAGPGARARGEEGAEKPATALEREKARGKEFLEKAAQEEGAVKTRSGFVYLELRKGTGPRPWSTNTVRVHYTGALVDGTVFDSSVARGKPAVFNLQQVIRCWTEGMQLMKAGGKARLVCPPELAYGDQAAGGGAIPAGATLVFEVELLAVVDP
jgi:FKBP-type peptidyl-prolyl cis-trans isomerase FkpA